MEQFAATLAEHSGAMAQLRPACHTDSAVSVFVDTIKIRLVVMCNECERELMVLDFRRCAFKNDMVVVNE